MRGTALSSANAMQAVDYITISLSSKGEIASWDAAAEALTGFRAQDVMGGDIEHLVAVPTPQSHRALAALRAGFAAKFGALIRCKDGGLVAVEIEAKARGDAPGAISLRDLTAERLASGASRHAGERLKLALGAAAIGAYEIDLLTQRYQLDGRASAIWGRDPTDSICFSMLADQVLDEDRPAAEGALAAASDPAGDGSYATEFRIRRHGDGVLRWLSLRGRTFFENGQPVSRIGVMLDVTQNRRLEEDNAHLAAIVGTTGDAIYSLTLDGAVRSWNPAAERMFGVSSREMIGKAETALIPPELQSEAEALFEAAKAGDIVRRETKRLRRDGSSFDVLLSIAPMRGRNGDAAAISVLARDISDEKRVLAQLEQANARMAQQTAELDAVFEALNVPVTVFNRDGAIARTNAAARAVWGVTPDMPQPLPFGDVAAQLSVRNSAGETIDPAALAARRALAGESVGPQHYQITSPSGLKHDFETAELPLIVDGAITGAVAVWHDVTEARRRDDQASILLRELSHRSKNLLSVIESILRQSAKGSVSKDDFVARFSDRLRALAHSHDLLAKTNSLSVSMTDLIFSQVGHHWEPGQRRIMLSGLGVRLKPDAAQMIGMALHELSTNAAKYGALSNAIGRVSIGWRVDHEAEAEPMFVLNWVERGGPPVQAPERAGFGTTVIQRVAGQSLRGTASLIYPEEGVSWTLRAPRSSVIDTAQQDAPRAERIRSPALEKLQTLWTNLYRDGKLPRLDELSLDDIEPQDHVIVADVDNAINPPAVRFVSVGKALVDRMGLRRECQDIEVSETEILGAEDGAYRRCIRSGRPAYEYAYFNLTQGRSFFFERLLLPLSDDGQRVSRIIGMASFDDGVSAGAN
ncbi:signal transduction histidine kinase [Methylocella silvestris BL2]|uniref:Blue-light-activated histidine kinase n=1 Tax=Methylocella silvestris (strain DSM 15510 / CIP 108128 / LMG 27833 / NCIMB 13906 / BL2) TaxID=395965 RepID=B8ENW1_METSB|nr:PAS domain S-box protein [Methylocella silvestris]ACK49199.1 signal transduction histidine kinase [Methylocella silvestris BL2]